MRFEGQMALGTGAAGGIGQAIEELNASARLGRVAGHEDILADLADPDAPEDVLKQIAAKTNQLHLLGNNAGLMREGTVEKTSLGDWNPQLRVNLTAPFLMIRHAMPLLRNAKGASVNAGSIEGLGSTPRHPAYSASRAAWITGQVWTIDGGRLSHLSLP